MKSYEAFKAFYSEELFSELMLLDGIRKKILIKSFIAAIILLLLALLIPLFSVRQNRDIVMICTWIFCISAGYGAIRFITKGYRYHFKDRIIEPLIRFINPDLKYIPDGFVDLYTFRRAELFQRYCNEFDGEDLICGTIGKTSIKFSEVRARYKDEDADLSTVSAEGHPIITAAKYLFAKCFCDHEVFRGLFFVSDFHKTFYGKVLVLPDKAEKYFRRFGDMMQDHNFLQEQHIKMDNAEFERHFVVYGSDQIQSRYVLTPAIMNKILDFKKKTGSTVWLSFKNSILYMAVPCKKDLFEPRYLKSLVDYVATFEYFHDLSLFTGIVEEFNLNTRIWTKE